MNTLHNKYDTIEKLIFDEGLQIESLEINPALDSMIISLNKNIRFIARLSFYERLRNASPERLQDFTFIAKGTGIHWPKLDEDLSLKGFLKDFLWQKVKNERALYIS
jgi:hypothetical protein